MPILQMRMSGTLLNSENVTEEREVLDEFLNSLLYDLNQLLLYVRPFVILCLLNFTNFLKRKCYGHSQ